MFLKSYPLLNYQKKWYAGANDRGAADDHDQSANPVVRLNASAS
jgi:hypothetical protein